MNDKDGPDNIRADAPPEDNDIIIRIRRRSLAEWMAWLLWLIALALLLEYALTSFGEREAQAGTVASMGFLSLLVAGGIVEIMRRIDSHNPYQVLNRGDEPESWRYPPDIVDDEEEDDYEQR